MTTLKKINFLILILLFNPHSMGFSVDIDTMIANALTQADAGIYPDKSQFSATEFLDNDRLAQCPYTVECFYSNNEREYKGTLDHAFIQVYRVNHTHALVEMWHEKKSLLTLTIEKQSLNDF